MLGNFNNQKINNKRNSNYDLINIREEYTNLKTTMSTNAINSGNKSININEIFRASQQEKIKNYEKINLSEKKAENENNMNIIKLKKTFDCKNYDNINNKILYREKLLSKKKTQTQTDLFWDRVAFYKTYLNKIPIVSVIKKKNKKKINNSERNTRNKIIYYNSSIEDLYKSKSIAESSRKDKMDIFSYLPDSNKVIFINKILNLNKTKNKHMKIKLNKKSKEEKEQKEINNKLLKGFNILAGNKSALKVLFKKTPIKIKDCVPYLEKRVKSQIFLNPITNSYGNLLDNLSEKIGFMKDSMNMIYPKISKAKYESCGPSKEIELTKRKRSLISDYNIYQNFRKSKSILYKIKKRKINNTIYSKYPIYSRNKNMGEIFTTKIYSLNRKSK
jgi:hypothetical protein